MTPTEERIRHYLNQLPEPYRSQALSQVKMNVMVVLELNEIESRRSAVTYFCDWESTIEGFDYWCNLCASLPINDPTPESIQSEINELQYRIDTLKEELKNLTK